jgi:dethiobiotin synthetase
MPERFFITSIHTDSGKTLISTIIAQALQADYWKPIQAGHPRDTETVQKFLRNKRSVVHPEAYLLNAPMSPHAAARLDHIYIHPENILMPYTEHPLVIEGAGGILAPINDEHFIIDLVDRFDAEVILVANIYLGSINHTLLTVNELKRRDVRVKGIVFNGPPNPETETIILKHSGYRCLLRVQPEPEITQKVINRYAMSFMENVNGEKRIQ